MNKPFCITTLAPRMRNDVTVNVKNAPLKDGEDPLYEINYYCGARRDMINGVILIEWDTDPAYAYTFFSETEATEVLEKLRLDGSRVQKYRFDGANKCEAKERIAKLIFNNPQKKN